MRTEASKSTTLPLGREDFARLVSALQEAIAGPAPQLLDQPDAMRYCGMSKSGWFRARSAGLLPQPVFVEGSGLRFRRADLDKFIAGLKPSRRKS